MIQKLFGDRAFFRRVMAVALPIIIQNGITNFVSLLDNIMVGQVGTAQMGGVAIVNQLLFVFNLCIFGAVSGAGIFTAQFYGCQNHEGVRHTFRFKVLVSLLLGVLGIAVFLLAGSPLIRLYLQGEGTAADRALTLEYGRAYMKVMLLGLLPFALANAYSSTLREMGQATVPMVAGISAVAVNLTLNYVLIFGHFGAPALGVQGAAIATVVSRYVELAVVAGWTHLHSKKNPFIQGAYRSMYIPGQLVKTMIRRGTPLLLNESMWSLGMAMTNQCYSVRGLDVMNALNISSTLYNLASVVFMSMGSVVGILMGQELGSGLDKEQIRRDNGKMTRLSVLSCLVFAGLMIAVSGLFPQIYNTTDQIRSLAAKLICISALLMPFNAYTNAAYFTLRSGGQTFVTFLFDSCFVWACCVPLAFLLSRLTDIPILPLYAITQGTDLIKCGIGYFLVRGEKWMQNLAQTN